MPARILTALSPMSNITDFVMLSSLAAWQGFTAIISQEDWNRITGPNGLVFVLIVGLIVMWGKSVKDDASRERRHRETLDNQKQHFNALIELSKQTSEELKELTVDAIKAQMKATSAIVAMDHNIIKLTDQIVDSIKINNDKRH